MLKHLNIATLIVLAFSLFSCGNDGTDEPVVSDGMVNMVISVASIDSQPSVPTRADETYFEDPVSRFERIHTLRYIIVRPDGKVEHNYFVTTAMADNGVDYHNNITFKVVGGEKKQIYIIANEASVPGYDFGQFVAGAPFKAAEAESLTLVAPQPGMPLFDNSDESTAHYLPMAEHFEVNVTRPSETSDGPTYQYETLFITRSTVKFSFSAQVSPVSPSDIVLKKVIFNNIGDRQFLFPKNTEYSPSKYPVSGSDRIITAYDVPDGAETSQLPFDLDWNFPPMTAGGKVTSSSLYFPETAFSGKYSATIVVGVDGEDFEYTADLPNLPSLPRNTHVKVDMVLKGHSVTCVVDVAQYIGVTLEPEFGFVKLHPNQK